jgi:hypothetical protein
MLKIVERIINLRGYMSARVYEPNLDFMKTKFSQKKLFENMKKDLQAISDTLSSKEKEQFAHYIEGVSLIETSINDLDKAFKDDKNDRVNIYKRTRKLINTIKDSMQNAKQFLNKQLSNLPSEESEQGTFLKQLAPQFQSLLHPFLRGIWKVGGKDSVNSNPSFPKVENEADKKFVELVVKYLKAFKENVNNFEPDKYIVEGPIGIIVSIKGGIAKVVGEQIDKVIAGFEKRLASYQKINKTEKPKIVQEAQVTGKPQAAARKLQAPIKRISTLEENQASQDKVKPPVEPMKGKPSQQIVFEGIEDVRKKNKLTQDDNFIINALDSILDQFDEKENIDKLAQSGLSEEIREISLSEVKAEEEKIKFENEEELRKKFILNEFGSEATTRRRAEAITVEGQKKVEVKPSSKPLTFSNFKEKVKSIFTSSDNKPNKPKISK